MLTRPALSQHTIMSGMYVMEGSPIRGSRVSLCSVVGIECTGITAVLVQYAIYR